MGSRLDDSQRAAVALQRCWSRLRPEDCGGDVEAWWQQLLATPRDSLTNRQRAVVEAYESAKRCRDALSSAAALGRAPQQGYVLVWFRRSSVGNVSTALPSRPTAAAGGLRFRHSSFCRSFLPARSVVRAGQDLLGEALCSSYEAFRLTRQNRDAAKDSLDEEDDVTKAAPDLSHARWYLREFDQALERTSGATHPKMSATVKKVVDLWEAGEKVLVFAFYRRTCRALRIHISQEIERRMFATAQRRLGEAGREADRQAIERLLEGIQKRFVDDPKSPGRKALDHALAAIIAGHAKATRRSCRCLEEQRDLLTDVMRRFLRVTTTLVRCFPIEELADLKPAEVVGESAGPGRWIGNIVAAEVRRIHRVPRRMFHARKRSYLEAARRTQTGGIRVEDDEDDDSEDSTVTLANVQVATGTTKRETRARLMRAFNTPFFPDILVCSQVMGEGVDLQRFCRHVIHHDLAWNPSTIEQRTGRIDRLGCKAEGRQPIVVYLPYLAGTADERQYQVMSDRERWFRVVMGQEEVARLITPDSSSAVRLPDTVSSELAFQLGLKFLNVLILHRPQSSDRLRLHRALPESRTKRSSVHSERPELIRAIIAPKPFHGRAGRTDARIAHGSPTTLQALADPRRSHHRARSPRAGHRPEPARETIGSARQARLPRFPRASARWPVPSRHRHRGSADARATHRGNREETNDGLLLEVDRRTAARDRAREPWSSRWRWSRSRECSGPRVPAAPGRRSSSRASTTSSRRRGST